MTTTDTRNTRILALLFIGVLMGALDISIVGPAIPAIEETIQVEQRSLGWIFSIYVLFNLVGISLFARLSDLFGRRNIYILALSIFGVGSFVVSVSDSFSVLLLGRAIQGFGASGIFPVASAVVGDIFPPEKRGSVLGLIGAVFGVAFIIGPILAGTLLAFFEWHMLFIINLPIAVGLIIGSWKLLPTEPVAAKERLDWLGIILLAVLLSSFAYGINQIDSTQFLKSVSSLAVGPFLLLSFVCLIGFILTERRVHSPIVKPEMFFNRQIRLVGVIALGTGLLQASFVFIPDFAVGSFQVSSATASFMLLPLVLSTAIGSPLFGRQLDQRGSRVVIIIGLILAATGFILLWLTGSGQWLFYIGGIFIGLGMSVLAGSSLRYIMLNEVGAVDRAATQGVLTIFISLGQLTGSALIGMITAEMTGVAGYRQVFFYLGIALGLLLLAALQLKDRETELATIVGVSASE